MSEVKIIRLNETTSTNAFLRDYGGDEGWLMTVAVAKNQTSGRGQGSNTWESEPGKNLLFSILTHTVNVPAMRQFALLEAAALAVVDTLRRYTGGLTIKWPNDIYWNDYKISGTLSECTIVGGMIDSCITGTGINVNQQVFRSDAPNPVSLCQILGHEVDLNKLLDELIDHYKSYLAEIIAGHFDYIHRLYIAALYRATGFHEYEDKHGRFMATLDAVDPDGHIALRRMGGEIKKYAFKEVKYIVDNGPDKPYIPYYIRRPVQQYDEIDSKNTHNNEYDKVQQNTFKAQW